MSLEKILIDLKCVCMKESPSQSWGGEENDDLVDDIFIEKVTIISSNNTMAVIG